MSQNIDLNAHFAKYPLKNILWTFCSLYRLSYTTPCERVFDKPIHEDTAQNPIMVLIDQFISYFFIHLERLNEAKDIYSRLRRVSKLMGITPYDLTPFESLATLILRRATDLEIWNSLIQLVDNLESKMMATDSELKSLAAKSIFRRVVESHKGIPQTMEYLKNAMRRELNGSVFFNTIGFWKKYFQNPRLDRDRDSITIAFLGRSSEPKFQFPKVPNEAEVWEWMKAIEDDLFSSVGDINVTPPKDGISSTRTRFGKAFTGTQFHTLAAGQITGSQSNNQVDYFIKRKNLPVDHPHHWRDILVVGELTKSTTEVFLEKFLQLSVYMRQVFMAQPLRRFVHGFILFEKDLQLWVYDRSGPYSCSFMDIGASPVTLVHVLATYMLMDDGELGLDTSTNIEYKNDKMIVKLKVPRSEEFREIVLEPEPIFQREAYLSRGTTCFEATDKSCVVKFSWSKCGYVSEVDLMTLADNIPGMAKIIGSIDLVKISELRKDLLFTETMVKWTRPDEKVMTTPLELSGETRVIPRESLRNQLARKRKSEAINSGKEIAGSSKKIRTARGSKSKTKAVSELKSRPVAPANTDEPMDLVGGRSNPSQSLARTENNSVSEKRKTFESAEVNDRMKRINLSSNAGLSTNQRAAGPSEVTTKRSNPQDSNSNVRKRGSEASKVPGTPAVSTVKTKVIVPRERLFTAVGITPYGRPIYRFESVLELVIGLNDAIKAHRTLLLDSKILHRDISVNNILLTKTEMSGEYGGVLIDLDLATLFHEGQEHGKYQVTTGTMEFTALEILDASQEGSGAVVTHTYRHDLESFFYVLVWMCIRYGWTEERCPYGNFLSKWYTGTMEEILQTKLYNMSQSKFRTKVLEKFSPKFKVIEELILKLWKILFPGDDFDEIDDPENRFILYDHFIEAFENTIHGLKAQLIFPN